MIVLFILGAFIGSGACMLAEITATNINLNKKIEELEKKENDNIST